MTNNVFSRFRQAQAQSYRFRHTRFYFFISTLELFVFLLSRLRRSPHSASSYDFFLLGLLVKYNNNELCTKNFPFPFASKSSTYPKKLSAYKCGSDPFDDVESRFDIRIYHVSISFIILDREVTSQQDSSVWILVYEGLFIDFDDQISLYEWKVGA
ncbi:NADH-ubiquinone/plastoquinone oxidoreductase, chain 3 [Medicago truncatula]|uniref:NADH-ubiquinone oxidoreductase chain 3 n=1 Tax=Medicago truncatula TaxID=3880 RepID=G7IQ88_MEDTR|nr:NADH-ubiquinone/plastoquinone oxidoreductase, chain 3 [Medicago truncatula]